MPKLLHHEADLEKSQNSCFVRSIRKTASKQLLKCLFSEWGSDRSGLSKIIHSTFNVDCFSKQTLTFEISFLPCRQKFFFLFLLVWYETFSLQ